MHDTDIANTISIWPRWYRAEAAEIADSSTQKPTTDIDMEISNHDFQPVKIFFHFGPSVG